MNTEDTSDIEIVDLKTEILELYVRSHKNDINLGFQRQIREVIENFQKQISGMALEVRHLNKERTKMQENQVAILKELRREQNKANKNETSRLHNIKKLQEDREKMINKCKKIIFSQRKENKKLEILADKRKHRIAELENTLNDRNDRLLVVEENLECWENKKCADMQTTIDNLQKDILSLNESAKKSHKLISKQQMMIQNYQKAFSKIQSRRMKAFRNEEFAFLLSPKVMTKFEASSLDTKCLAKETKECKIVLTDCKKYKLKRPKRSIKIQYFSDSHVEKIHEMPNCISRES